MKIPHKKQQKEIKHEKIFSMPKEYSNQIITSEIEIKLILVKKFTVHLVTVLLLQFLRDVEDLLLSEFCNVIKL